MATKVKAAMAAAASVKLMATSSSSRAAAVAASGKLLEHVSFCTHSNVCQYTALAGLEGLSKGSFASGAASKSVRASSDRRRI